MIESKLVEMPLWPEVERTDEVEQVLEKLSTFITKVQRAR